MFTPFLLLIGQYIRNYELGNQKLKLNRFRLNRTLLLPPFLTHQTDSSGGDNPVPVDIRLDIPKLRELLSIGFTDDLQCRQSDVVFLARGIYNKPTDPSVMMERVKRIENFEKEIVFFLNTKLSTSDCREDSSEWIIESCSNCQKSAFIISGFRLFWKKVTLSWQPPLRSLTKVVPIFLELQRNWGDFLCKPEYLE